MIDHFIINAVDNNQFPSHFQVCFLMAIMLWYLHDVSHCVFVVWLAYINNVIGENLVVYISLGHLQQMDHFHYLCTAVLLGNEFIPSFFFFRWIQSPQSQWKINTVCFVIGFFHLLSGSLFSIEIIFPYMGISVLKTRQSWCKEPGYQQPWYQQNLLILFQSQQWKA